MSMSEMVKGAHAKADAVKTASATSFEITFHANELLKKLDEQLDQVDITLVKLSNIASSVFDNDKDYRKMRNLRQHIFDMYEEAEKLVEKI
tara:strand:+ start:578 stop:850 length:273 start_codon:yes stop_codon:yes gene_type:complete